MASVKFDKGSEEWLMFMDYWNLCQKYWQVEKNDDYWDKAIADTNAFCEKYKVLSLAKKLALAFIEDLDENYKKSK